MNFLKRSYGSGDGRFRTFRPVSIEFLADSQQARAEIPSRADLSMVQQGMRSSMILAAGICRKGQLGDLLAEAFVAGKDHRKELNGKAGH
jgi:hypothetical protein